MNPLTEHRNVRSFKELAKEKLSDEVFDYLAGGVDDGRTLRRNKNAYEAFQIRPRRLVDVRHIDTSIELFGEKWPTPIIIAPVGLQGLFHPDAEIATAKAAQSQRHLMIASTVSQHPYTDIAKEILSILKEELIRNMRLAGTPSILDINRNHVQRAKLL